MTDTSVSIDKLEFTSPINLERTSGLTPLADAAKSTMELFGYSDDANRFGIEWIVDELDLAEWIGIWIEVDPKTGKRTLTDYDGVFTLPDQAMDLLERNSIDCAEMRRDLSDDDEEAANG